MHGRTLWHVLASISLLVVLAGTAPPRQAPPAAGLTLPATDIQASQIVEWLSGATGKTVLPIRPQQLRSIGITVWNGSPLDDEQMLTTLYRAMLLAGIGVIETDDTIILGQVQEIMARIAEMPVVGADEDLFGRPDRNTFITRFYRLEHADAERVTEQLAEVLPDYASLLYDEATGLITFTGDLTLARHLQMRIEELDRAQVAQTSRVFRLRHARAGDVAERIAELFNSPGGGPRRVRPVSPSIRATADERTNSVIVVGDARLVELIAPLVEKEWDRPGVGGG